MLLYVYVIRKLILYSFNLLVLSAFFKRRVCMVAYDVLVAMLSKYGSSKTHFPECYKCKLSIL